MTIRSATPDALDAVTDLALALWPGHAPAALREEMAAKLLDADALILLAEADGKPVGFAECGLRHDYVEGTESSPVGYLEGIYVTPGARRSGVAAGLVAACERWSRARGCREFASDCTLDNTLSIAFHLGAGFREAGRIVCFVKEL